MIRKLVVIASVLVIGLTGCSKKKALSLGEEPNNPRDKGTPTAPATPVVVPPEEVVKFEKLLGNWQLVGITYASQSSESVVEESLSHFFSFTQDYDEFKMTYQAVPNAVRGEGYFSLVGNDLTVNWAPSGTAMHVYGARLTAEDDLFLPDSNPSISTVKERHYKRISDENMAYVLHTFGIN